MMIMIGVFEVIAGISAISTDDVFVKTPNYVFDLDVSTWGWIHLTLGLIVIFASWALIAGRVWGGLVGIALATLVAIAKLLLDPVHPVLVDPHDRHRGLVIWALTRPGVYRQ